jgi:hypothetical protein
VGVGAEYMLDGAMVVVVVVVVVPDFLVDPVVVF